jgi:hypothetical protein
MCYWILTDDTKNLIVRGTVRSAKNIKRPDMRYAGNPQDAHDEDKEDKPSANSDFQLDADGDDDRKPAAKPTPSTQTRESNAFPLIVGRGLKENR